MVVSLVSGVRLTIGMIMMLLIVMPVLPEAFWKRMSTIGTYKEDQDPSALGRLHYWDVALSMATKSDTGIGFNGFNEAYDAFDSSDGLYAGEICTQQLFRCACGVRLSRAPPVHHHFFVRFQCL